VGGLRRKPALIRTTCVTPPPNAADPETLVVPYFAPDEMDHVPEGGSLHSEWAGENVQAFPYPNSYVPDLQRAIREFDRQNSFRGVLGDYWPGYEVNLRTTT
jgi:hypothetical protein